MKEINWGFIGCGEVTELKSGPAFNKVEGSKVVAVMSKTASKAEDYAHRHNIPKWYDKAEKLISDPEVNAVYIATPPKFHSSYAIDAMNEGKPVYVEKPMAVSYKECQKMNDIASRRKVPLFVAYYRRSLPYFLKVKELIEKDVIGRIFCIDIRFWSTAREEDYNTQNPPWRVIPEISGGGYFYDMACHQLDILDYFFGPVKNASGKYANKGGLYDAEDTVSASIEFESGIIATGSWCFVAEKIYKTDTIEILGSKGKIIFSAFAFKPIVLVVKDIITKYNPSNPANIQFCLIKDVVEELQGAGKSPSDGTSGARTNKVMDMILNKITK
ncbi:MAG: Gfo/Idh/MocA family oxidoreductase [Bacteroidales bacterium]|nr:MAG: Gfo/Idh/MocA family oxidoreductase [Bacteroidales bacterium]